MYFNKNDCLHIINKGVFMVRESRTIENIKRDLLEAYTDQFEARNQMIMENSLEVRFPVTN